MTVLRGSSDKGATSRLIHRTMTRPPPGHIWVEGLRVRGPGGVTAAEFGKHVVVKGTGFMGSAKCVQCSYWNSCFTIMIIIFPRFAKQTSLFHLHLSRSRELNQIVAPSSWRPTNIASIQIARYIYTIMYSTYRCCVLWPIKELDGFGEFGRMMMMGMR